MSFMGGMGPSNANGGLRFGSTRGRIQGAPMGGMAYPTPFFDVAQTYLPTTMKALLKYCRYYFLTQPTINAVVFKMSEYPVTDIIIDHKSEHVVKLWTEFFNDQIRFNSFRVECGLDYHCFSGETRVVTRAGVFPIRELSGRTVDVLSEGGVYRPASFRCYGKQRLWEVHTEDGVLFATDKHRWPVWDTKQKKIVWKVTKDLKNKKIPRVVAARPEKNEDFWAGVRHGIVFGDGTLSNEGRQAHVLLHTREKQQLARYFEGHCATITPHHQEKYLGVYGLDPSLKSPPKDDASSNYWYGFTCGLLATDGSVSKRDGCVTLNQKAPEVLLEISKRLPWFGLLGGKVREYQHWSNLTKQEEPINVLNLNKQYLLPEDFVRPDQKMSFEEKFEKTSYGKFIAVKKVTPTDRIEDVFCCTEPETKSFVIEHGVLTGNCYGNSAVSIHYPFQKYLECRQCKFNESAARIRTHWLYTNNAFRLTCPKCGQTTDARASDLYIKNASAIRTIRWNPEDIDITYNDTSGEYTYYYTIPSRVKNDVALGKKDVVEKLPQNFLQAIKENKGIVFAPNMLFHHRRATLADQDRGWGIPLLLPVLKDTFYLQIMKKAQEAILLEHIVPLRVLFPQPGSGSSDPYTSINLTDWRDHVATEIARWRYDNNYIPIMPLPLGQQTIGGDGRALLMTPEMQAMTEIIINGMQAPLEFIKGGLSYAGTNVSMRMLENQFIGYNQRQLMMAKFIMREVSSLMGWPMANIRFKPFKMADDIQRKALLMQLNQANKISDTTLLRDSDLSQDEENEIMLKEFDKRLEVTKKQQLAMAEVQGEAQKTMMKYQAEAQQAAQQAMQQPLAQGEPGGPPGGADPMQGMQSQLNLGQQVPQNENGMGVNLSLMGLARAQANLLQSLPPEQQHFGLENLRLSSPELAALVEQFLRQGGGGGGAEGGGQPNVEAAVDMRPMPEKLPARRAAGMV
jgi:hypothetical protein